MSEPSTNSPGMIDALPGWLCVTAGLVLLAIVVLMPGYLATRTTRWQLELIREQAQRMDRELAGYEQFEDALDTRDPAVIERLAFAELRLKPVGEKIVGPPSGLMLGPEMRTMANPPRWPTSPATHLRPGQSQPQASSDPPAAYEPGAIDDWLHIAQPVVGLDYPTKPTSRSLATRLSTGPLRWVGLTVALTILLIGILFTPGKN